MNKKEFKQYLQAMVHSMLEKVPGYNEFDPTADLSEDYFSDDFQEDPSEDIPEELIEELSNALEKLEATYGFGDDWGNIHEWGELTDWAGMKDADGYGSSDSCGFSDPCDWENPCHPKKPSHKPKFKKHFNDDKWLKCFIFTCLKLKLILCLLKNGKFGLREIKREIELIEKAIFNPTFGLKEIKKEIRRIECGIFSPTFGLPEIKSEVSAIESAIFSETFGLQEIKSEVSTLLFEFEQFLAAQGPAQNLTTGPFLATAGETVAEVKAFNATATFQSVTFEIFEIGTCPLSLIDSVAFLNITPCCGSFALLTLNNLLLTDINVIINAEASASFGIFLYAASRATATGPKVTEFFSADFLPLGTICV
ncbi:hypothetical protein [Desulforamulus putei]|uniref:Uncharacterized protein n=1 Tax=Desulforamulus putei DSM 12395 TaxID=1121429 RepID=A0A1M4S8F8_9FIRM|nr:hypothetical protein [Desulforamulus putei]SHE28455.1 hypothetical protein SAMN02745133_00006 [Desulforamulus putei DSM 12395]